VVISASLDQPAIYIRFDIKRPNVSGRPNVRFGIATARHERRQWVESGHSIVSAVVPMLLRRIPTFAFQPASVAPPLIERILGR